MEISKLEKAIKRVVRAERPMPLLAMAGSLPEEFEVAAGTLSARTHDQPIAKRTVKAAAKPWT